MIGKEIRHGSAIVAAVLALAGCGGGSSGDTSSAAAPAANTAVTKDNGAPVAGQVYGAANGLYGSGSTAAVAIKSMDSTTPAPATVPGVADFAVRRLLSLRGTTSGISTKATQNASLYCGAGGSMTFTLVDADNNGDLSTGDSGTITFAGCKESGLTINGSFGFSGVVITGTAATPSVSVGATYTYRQLSIGNGQEMVAVDGALALQATIANAAPYTFDISGSGTQLAVTSGARSMTLTNFTSTAHLDTSAGTYAYTTQGTLTLGAQGVALTVSTPTPLGGTLGGLPSSGVMVARATDGSAARLTVVSATAVTVETDGDGNGTWDSTQSLTWTQFLAL